MEHADENYCRLFAGQAGGRHKKLLRWRRWLFDADRAAYCKDCQKVKPGLNCAGCEHAAPRLWPELAPLADLWVQVQSQWKTNGFGPTGMDWHAVREIADLLGLDLTPADFRRLKSLEDDTLKEWLEHASDKH